MANGWQRLGEAFAGVNPARRADIEAKTMNQLATRDANVARARDAMAKSEALASLGSYFADLGIENPEAAAGVGRSGVNLNTITGGMGNLQEQQFRQAARDAAVGGNMGAANAELFGIASGPIEIPKVTGGVLLSNRLIPGGGDVSVTPVGQSTIDKNRVTGEAAMVRANRPAASRGGGSASAPKLSEIDKMRMNAELKAIEPQMQVVLDEVAKNRGATVGPGVRKLADAQAAMAELQAQQQAIFDKYSNAAGSPGAAPPARISEMFGVPVPAGMTPDQFGQAVAFNQGLRAEGQPDMTRDEMAQFLSTGEFSRRAPAAAAPAESISPRLFDKFQQSLTGDGAPPRPGVVARPTTKAERDRLPPGTRYIAPDGTERIKK